MGIKFLRPLGRVGNSFICSFTQIAQDKWANVSDLLRSLRTNEQMWANHSGCSWQRSECELFAQVAQDKWADERNAWVFLANPSFSLVLTKNEQFAQKFENIVFFVRFYSFFVSFLKMQRFRLFLLSKVSESLRSLRTKEQRWATSSGRSEGMSNCERIVQVAH